MQAEDKKNVAAKLWIRGIVVLAIVGLITFAVLSVPPGIDMNLIGIGKGQPALVFVYDPNLTVSGAQINEMNRVRDHYTDTVLFLVADIGVPDAQALVHQHQADVASLLVFGGDGALITRASALLEADELHELLRKSLPEQL